MANKKGMSMPIEIIVVVAVVVLVLVVVVAFFVMQSGKNIDSIGVDSAWGQGCTILSMQKNCQIDPDAARQANTQDSILLKQRTLKNIEIPGYLGQDGKRKSLYDACVAKGYSIDDCWKFCGCY